MKNLFNASYTPSRVARGVATIAVCVLALGACASDRSSANGNVAGAAANGASGNSASGSNSAAAGAGGSGVNAGASGTSSDVSGNGSVSTDAAADNVDASNTTLQDGAISSAADGGNASDTDAGNHANADAGASTSTCTPWPAATTTVDVTATIHVTGTYDGKLQRFRGKDALGSGDQSEDQPPIFNLDDGAVLMNVIVGAPAADGIHCNGSCRLQNVWWEDVGEDAATFRGTSAAQSIVVECAGAKHASDKVLQHNGPGTLVVSHFYVEDFGKLYRSCGNCKTQYERHVQLSDIDAKGGTTLVGINTNYHDSATFSNITIHDASMKTHVCDRYTGNDQGDEPPKTGSGADSQYCLYSDSDIHWLTQ